MTRRAAPARRAQHAWAALRDFLRGFAGLAGASGTGPAPGSAAARRALEERAARRPPCC